MREIQVSQAANSSPPRLQLPASLLWHSQSLHLTALIDSGADENFIDRNAAEQLGLEIVTLKTPLEATALNSLMLARVDYPSYPPALRKPSREDKLTHN